MTIQIYEFTSLLADVPITWLSWKDTALTYVSRKFRETMISAITVAFTISGCVLFDTYIYGVQRRKGVQRNVCNTMYTVPRVSRYTFTYVCIGV
jgi:hypothetical protein